jgi:hypothetical protein
LPSRLHDGRHTLCRGNVGVKFAPQPAQTDSAGAIASWSTGRSTPRLRDGLPLYVIVYSFTNFAIAVVPLLEANAAAYHQRDFGHGTAPPIDVNKSLPLESRQAPVEGETIQSEFDQPRPRDRHDGCAFHADHEPHEDANRERPSPERRCACQPREGHRPLEEIAGYPPGPASVPTRTGGTGLNG